MLFSLEKVPNTGLDRLHEMISGFYQSVFQGSSYDECFCTDLSSIRNESSKLAALMLDVYQAYSDLGHQSRRAFQQRFDQERNIQPLFDDLASDITNLGAEHSDLWSKCKSLSNYLYAGVLRLQCFQNLSQYSLDEHFEDFRNLNGNICCFCGLEEYAELRELSEDLENLDESQWRGDYDHLLCKSKYPFLSVDFENLVPTCRTCNRDAKGAIDILCLDSDRTVAFHPYRDEQGANWSLSVDVEDAFFMEWNVKFSSDNDMQRAKSDTWLFVYDIRARYQKRINDHSQSYYAASVRGTPNLSSAREALMKGAKDALCNMRNKRESFMEAECLKVLSELDESVLNPIFLSINDHFSGRDIIDS